MTPIAGVRDAEFLRQARVGHGEAVVVARVALHINRRGHVAIRAQIAGAIRLVMAVRGEVNARRAFVIVLP